MNSPSTPTRYTPDHLGRLHDLAKQRAHELRREALDEFWRGADAALARTVTSARQSAQRLAYRLARRAKGRMDGLGG